MPRGWSSSPIDFHSRMVQEHEGIKAIVYVDDLFVGGQTIEEHDCHLREVFKRLKLMGMHVKSSKLFVG